MLRTIVTAGLVLGLLFVGSRASAQYGGPEQIQPTRSALWAEVGFYSGSPDPGPLAALDIADASATAISPTIEGYFGITEAIEVGFQWGMVFVDAELDVAGVTEGDSAFAIGNPSVSGFYLARMDDAVLRLGVGVTLPVADGEKDGAPDGTRLTGYALAQGMRGLWDSWLWATDRLTFVVPQLRLDSRSRDLIWALEAAMGAMIDTGDADRDVEVPVQAALEGGVRLGSSFVIGGRFQAVWIPTLDEELDALQLAVEPFVRVELENAFFLARLTVNLDEPNGFAFNEHGVWGVHLGGGTRF